uniref:Uncharacterized protein n=1 Tax=Daphnia magna TaxID=35525 RepID=A0A0P6BLX4_9CRUS
MVTLSKGTLKVTIIEGAHGHIFEGYKSFGRDVANTNETGLDGDLRHGQTGVTQSHTHGQTGVTQRTPHGQTGVTQSWADGRYAKPKPSAAGIRRSRMTVHQIRVDIDCASNQCGHASQRHS